MEQLTNLKHDMPEMSEMITSFFTGNAPAAADKQKEKSKAIKSSKKSNKNN